jgi:thiosulfate/3-mercaptopyruvate sulfurtransferase
MNLRFFARRSSPMFLAAISLATFWMTQSAAPGAIAQSSPAQFAPLGANSIPEPDRIQPEALNRILTSKSASEEKPVVLQVGFHVMFNQAHIPDSQFVGPDSKPAGIQALASAVAPLAKDRFIVLYCGCCPWTRCPNVGPAYKRLRDLGYTHVKVLYLASNFGDDWVNKGYATEHGQ